MPAPRPRPVLGLLALVLAACAGGPADGATGDPVAGDPAVLGEAACGEVEETVDEGHHHLVGDAEPPTGYATEPPTSGWHYRDRARISTGVRHPDDPLTEPEQVSVLAVGGVVVSYDGLDEDDLRALTELVEWQSDRVALTPYDRLEPGQVALTAWRTRQLCSGFDEAAVSSFVERHAAGELDYRMGGPAPGDQPDGSITGNAARATSRPSTSSTSW